MAVYYHVKFQLYITSGSKVSRGVQNCTPPRNRMCSDPPGIGLTFDQFLGTNFQALINGEGRGRLSGAEEYR